MKIQTFNLFGLGVVSGMLLAMAASCSKAPSANSAPPAAGVPAPKEVLADYWLRYIHVIEFRNTRSDVCVITAYGTSAIAISCTR